jgi:4a-hydroxytetrahydrobiopterin dehydratase
MSELLDQAAIDAALARLDGWSGGPGGITRTAELSGFPAAIAVVDRVAEAAEAADHHPDIDIRWRTLTFRCSTHSAGGLTEFDVALAAAISDEIAAAGG